MELPPNPESFPTEAEVRALFEQLTEGEQFQERQKAEDKEGVYLWSILVKKDDGDVEYLYLRKGDYPEMVTKATEIKAVYYDTEGRIVGGTQVAEMVNGKLEII